MAIGQGFDKLPSTLAANRAIVVNAGGTAMVISTGTLSLLGNLAVATGKTFTASNTLTLTGTDGSSVNFGAGGTVVFGVAGTANEITAATVAGTTTLSLPSALTFTGKTVTGGTFSSPTISGTVAGAHTYSGALTLSAALTYGGVTLTNAVTGTGKMVLDTAPTIAGALTYGGVTLTNAVTGTGKMVLDASPTLSGTTTATGLFDISGVAAGQIKFPATQNASANVNTLDDYEEGTFVPTVTFGGGNTGMVLGVAVGFYTKVGDRVFFDISITFAARGSSTGGVSINGLPFAASAIANRLQTSTVWSSQFTLSANTVLQALHTSTNITLYQSGTGGGSASQITEGNLTNSAQIVISGQYAV